MASGLAASHRHPGVLYTHNDSGDTPRFFAIDANANVLAEVRLDGANALDREESRWARARPDGASTRATSVTTPPRAGAAPFTA